MKTASTTRDEFTSTSRRSFLKVGSLGLAGAGLSSSLPLETIVSAGPQQTPRGRAPIPDRATVKADGEWQEALVPDTLDLAQRAELSVNVLTRNVEPKNLYSVYQMLRLTAPELPERRAATLLWNGTAKNARTLPWMRTMCGSTAGLETEYEMMRVLNAAVDRGGQVRYVPVLTAPDEVGGDLVREGGGARVPIADSTANPIVNALVLLGMDMWQRRDGNPAWTDRIRLIGEGLRKIALQSEDRAYYPLECGYDTNGTWRVLRKGHLLPYTPPEEPMFDQQGAEGAVKIQNCRQLAALVRHYQITGDQRSLEMSRKLARFILKPTMWIDASDQGIAGHEHALWEGHFHGNMYTLHMLANLAAVDDDPWLRRFIQEGYHQGQRYGVTAIGWFPAWTHPKPGSPWGKGRPPAQHNNRTEGCAVSDMVVLGVKMTDAGLGDYWDDVDAIVRNHLVEQQFVDLDLMRKCGDGSTTHDVILSRFIGGFGSAHPTANLPRVAGCCTANCAVGLYYVWHGITRFSGGVATVNLFLNRASTWMDVDSYLPYEGKVVLRNKRAHTALVRVPGWLRTAHITSTLNGMAVQPGRSGAFLLFPNLQPRDEIRLVFPVRDSVEEYTVAGQKYRLTLRGTTIVDISPRPEEPGVYPTYLREHMKATRAPMVRARRFIPRDVLPLF